LPGHVAEGLVRLQFVPLDGASWGVWLVVQLVRTCCVLARAFCFPSVLTSLCGAQLRDQLAWEVGGKCSRQCYM
jgi:hypothetical protein